MMARGYPGVSRLFLRGFLGAQSARYLLDDRQNRFTGKSHQQSTRKLPGSKVTYLLYSICMKCNFSTGNKRKKKASQWQIIVTMVAHSFCSRQGLPHFICQHGHDREE
jgi:hypothetical protein